MYAKIEQLNKCNIGSGSQIVIISVVDYRQARERRLNRLLPVKMITAGDNSMNTK